MGLFPQPVKPPHKASRINAGFSRGRAFSTRPDPKFKSFRCLFGCAA